MRIVVVVIDVVVVGDDISDPLIYLVIHGPQTVKNLPRCVMISVRFGREYVSLDCLGKVDATEIEPFVLIV